MSIYGEAFEAVREGKSMKTVTDFDAEKFVSKTVMTRF